MTKKRLHDALARWVPGIISGGADNDPAGIATYSISGASFGFQQLWLLILTTPMLIAIQAMCARLGDVKQKGLMSIMREHYAPSVTYVASAILIITNIGTLGADITAVSDAIGLVTKTPLLLWVIPVTAFIWYIVVFKNYHIIEKFLFALTFIFIAYVISGFLVRPSWGTILHAIIFPSFPFSRDYFIAALGLIGTTITPFLFFWQSKQEMEEHKTPLEMKRLARQEDRAVTPGFIYSNLISLFIMISASVLYTKGISIATAADAARALEPIAGSYAMYVFAMGIIGSGLLAVPILVASTAYVVAETFGWKDSLSNRVRDAAGFYTVLTLSLFAGIGVALSGISPIQALLYSQVLNGLLAPFLIVLILFMCNDKKIMGTLVNGWFDNVFGGITVLVMLLASLGLFWQMVFSR